MILDYRRPGIPDYTKPSVSEEDERPARWLLAPALISGLLFFQYGSHWFSGRTCRNAPTDAAKTDISMLTNALDLYEADVGQYPTDADALVALHTSLPGTAGWHGPYVRRAIPNDPWGRPYVYHADGPTTPRILSAGPDGREGTADDIAARR